ncbi:hypothetical protein ABZX95_17190 [Streptomyces sp. NPDC004232]|uniref:hypothetical protein n=1 Tax=Streptomyces sp. NPDC004232 TaxID=3154454 RepID=UPI0033B19E63
MALKDDIEFYGRAVATREMTRADAAQALVNASEGGLTLYGAGDLIDKWLPKPAGYEEACRQYGIKP